MKAFTLFFRVQIKVCNFQEKRKYKKLNQIKYLFFEEGYISEETDHKAKVEFALELLFISLLMFKFSILFSV